MLVVGIDGNTDDITKFTDDELELISSFRFGTLCIHAGIGRIEGVCEFFDRIQITSLTTKYCKLPEWFDLELIEKMKAQNWSCNVTRETTDEWESKMKEILFEQICIEYGKEFGEDHSYSDRDQD